MEIERYKTTRHPFRSEAKFINIKVAISLFHIEWYMDFRISLVLNPHNQYSDVYCMNEECILDIAKGS